MAIKILWVEDETTTICGLVEKIRPLSKVTLEFAPTLKEAVTKINVGNYDLVIIDLNFHEPLPSELNIPNKLHLLNHNHGQYLAHWLDGQHPNIQYIFMTAVSRAYVEGINKQKELYDKNEMMPTAFQEKIISLFPGI